MLGVLTVLVLGVLWKLVYAGSLVSPVLLPSPEQVFFSFVDLVKNHQIERDIGYSVVRAVAGLITGSVIGIGFGLLVGYSALVKKLFGFLIDFSRSVPPVALLPLSILVFGTGEFSKFVVVVIVCLFAVLVNTIYGVKQANKSRLITARVFGKSRTQIFWKVVFPEALPYISAGVRLAVSYSLVMVVVSEMLVGAKFGLGSRIVDFHLIYKIPEMYAVIIVTGLVGYTFNWIYFYVDQKIHWAGR